jgi:hypothetical protein
MTTNSYFVFVRSKTKVSNEEIFSIKHCTTTLNTRTELKYFLSINFLDDGFMNHFALKTTIIKLIFFFITVIMLRGNEVYAQKGNNNISLGLEVGPTINWQRSGFPLQLGVPMKAYLGTGKKGQLMLRSGWHYFPNLSRQLDIDIESLTRTAVPLAFGYRHNAGNWYAEGSLGVAYDVILTSYKDPLLKLEEDISMEPHLAIEVGRSFTRYDLGIAVYNHGTAPFNILFIGLKSMYRIGGKKKTKENWWEDEN